MTTEEKRIYFDHAATSFPKPLGVAEAVEYYMKQCGASAGRGAYREAFEAKTLLEQTRSDLASLIGVKQVNRVLFTLNASAALNMALKGFLKAGDHVVVSSLEHNSVCRPLHALQKRISISFTQVPVSIEGAIDFQKLERALTPKTRLLVFLHASNVSGTLLPLQEISEFAQQKALRLLVDASQTLGAVPLNLQNIKIDLLAFPGHKSLLGPLGTGGLWVGEELQLETLYEGGTGSYSEEATQPLFWPDIHESGSHNLLGISGLGAALRYIHKIGVANIRQHKLALLQQLLEGVYALRKYKVIAAPAAVNAGVVSLQHPQLSPQDFALALDEKFRIQARPGLHCAPWAHQSFGTYPTGSVRLSLGYSNSSEEVESVLRALASI